MMRTRTILGATLGLLMATVVPPTIAAVPPPSLDPPTAIGTLDTAHPVLTFSGAVNNPTPFPLVNAPIAPVCAVNCQEFTFTATDTTPFLVSVKDIASSISNGWDLYQIGRASCRERV